MPRHAAHYLPYGGHRAADCSGLPVWAHAADAMTLMLGFTALSVAISGGFRTHVGVWRFAVTSPFRVSAWAIAVAMARHVAFRQHPVAGRVAQWIRTWSRSAAATTATMAFAATRPAMFAAGYLAVLTFGYAPGARPFHEFTGELLNLPLRWDAGWYLQIATSGYSYAAEAGSALQQNVVFFPAYPLLVRPIALVFGNGIRAFVMAGTVLSLGLFLLALAYFYRLAEETIGEKRAVTSVWLLATYPFALFYGAIYSESLYLVGAVAAFWHFRKQQYVPAACWGLLVGLTRPNGFLLSVPLAIAFFEGRSREPRSAARAGLFGPSAAAVTPLVGMVIFSVFVWRLAGDPLAWLSGHAAWGRHYQGLTPLVRDRFDYIARAGLGTYMAEQPYDVVNASAVLFVLASTWGVARRFGSAFAVFILINILPPLTTGGLISAGRLSSVLFPAFMWLAAVLPTRHAPGWIATFAALQALNAALFYTWRPLY